VLVGKRHHCDALCPQRLLGHGLTRTLSLKARAVSHTRHRAERATPDRRFQAPAIADFTPLRATEGEDDLRVRSRRGRDTTERLPELAQPPDGLVLDGEIVVATRS
jgi:hypothetical protein